MAILTTGITKIRDLVKSDITKGQMGTDGTLFNEAQTGVITPVAPTLLVISSTNINNGIKVTYDLPTNTGNGNSFQEFSLISVDTTTSYNRIVVPRIDKTNADAIQIDNFIVFDKNNV